MEEVNGHGEKNYIKFILNEYVPEGEPIIDSVWAMKCIQDIKTIRVYKFKSRMNVHGIHHEYRNNYTKI